jgi:hypothetical protein
LSHFDEGDTARPVAYLMSTAESHSPQEQSRVSRWFQIIAGTVIVLGVSTISYILLLTIASYLIHSKVLGVIGSAAMALWLGASAMKFIFPRVRHRAVFTIVAAIMAPAIVGAVIGMMSKGRGWEGLANSAVFLIMSGILIFDERSWETIPGRKP